MTKEEFIKRRDDHTADVIPLLHFYHNLCVGVNQKELSLEEFRKAYSMWLQIPIIAMTQGVIIYKVINNLQIHFKI